MPEEHKYIRVKECRESGDRIQIWFEDGSYLELNINYARTEIKKAFCGKAELTVQSEEYQIMEPVENMLTLIKFQQYLTATQAFILTDGEFGHDTFKAILYLMNKVSEAWI